MLTATDQSKIDILFAKQEIRELAQIYSRGVDRKDFALLRTLYTEDGTDDHGTWYNGGKEGFVDSLEKAMAGNEVAAHYVCNHLITVNGAEAQGEVYVIGYSLQQKDEGGYDEILMGVRYLDHYRVENGHWRFASRKVHFDFYNATPIDRDHAVIPAPGSDDSYAALAGRLFARIER